MILRRRNKSGTYYFRFFWQNKEFSKSLQTKDYEEAKQIKKELENLVMSKISGKKITAYEVNRIFEDYFIQTKNPKTKQAIKSKTERLKYYRANNRLNDLDIGIITELKLLKDLLSLSNSEADNKEKIKKLNSFKKQIAPLVGNYAEMISKDNAYTILQTQLDLANHDRKNFGIVEGVQYANISLKKAYDMYYNAPKKFDSKLMVSYSQAIQLSDEISEGKNEQTATPVFGRV